MLDVALRGFDIRVRIFFPALDRKKEILLHLWAGVVHAIMHVHRCVLRMQINFKLFVLNRDFSLAILVRGAGTTRSWNTCLPGPAIGQERADSDNYGYHPES